MTEDAQLIQSEQDHQDPADPGDPDPAVGKKSAQSGDAQSQHEKREADSDYEEDRVDGDPSLSVFLRRIRASGKVADIDRKQGQDAGGQEA